MKQFKYIMLLLVLFLSLALVGCGGETPGGQGGGGTEQPPVTDKTMEEVKTEVINTLKAYSDSDHGSFKLIVTDGDVVSSVDMTFNYDGGKSELLSLKTILTDEQGTMSCYVDEDEAYINRYDQSKTIVRVVGTEGDYIIENYNFDSFTEKMQLILNNSFFKYCTIASFADGLLKANLDLTKYEVDSEEINEDLFAIYDSLVSKTSVSLEVTYNETTVTSVKIIIVGDVTSSMELQFLGTSDGEIAIEFPDLADYTR